ncbi:MAG: hypothetical protein Fur006_45330 [Coleofasciculaceae cyanobacterium]
MEIKIFNVERGFCALIVADNKQAALIDCGDNQRTGFKPSDFMLKSRYSGMEKLIISSYNDHHLADLPNLLTRYFQCRLPTKFLIKNPSVNAETLPELLVRNDLTETRLHILSAIKDNSIGVTSYIEFGGINLAFFWNCYPEFLDIDNLSVVTFLHYRDINMIFPGNLKQAGWRSLLRQASFRKHLRWVNLFVASNHGYASGYYPEVLNYCDPDLVIISNGSSQSMTPEVLSRYRSHAKGFRVGDSEQKLLTTRNHGTITVSQSPGQSLEITTEQSLQMRAVY